MGQQTQTEKVPFSKMQAAIGKQFKEMSATRLFTTNVDGNELWQKYLDSFPVGSNPILNAPLRGR